MDEPLLACTRKDSSPPHFSAKEMNDEETNLSSQDCAYSISERYLNLFPVHIDVKAHYWNDSHFEGTEDVIAVFDTDFESFESFYRIMLQRYQKLTRYVIPLILLVILVMTAKIARYILDGDESPIFWLFILVLFLVRSIRAIEYLIRRRSENDKFELIRHIALTTEGVHIETNEHNLYRKNKRVVTTKIPYRDIRSCKYDFVTAEYRRKLVGDAQKKLGKSVQIGMKGYNVRNIEAVIHGDTMVEMILWLKDNILC